MVKRLASALLKLIGQDGSAKRRRTTSDQLPEARRPLRHQQPQQEPQHPATRMCDLERRLGQLETLIGGKALLEAKHGNGVQHDDAPSGADSAIGAGVIQQLQELRGAMAKQEAWQMSSQCEMHQELERLRMDMQALQCSGAKTSVDMKMGDAPGYRSDIQVSGLSIHQVASLQMQHLSTALAHTQRRLRQIEDHMQQEKAKQESRTRRQEATLDWCERGGQEEVLLMPQEKRARHSLVLIENKALELERSIGGLASSEDVVALRSGLSSCQAQLVDLQAALRDQTAGALAETSRLAAALATSQSRMQRLEDAVHSRVSIVQLQQMRLQLSALEGRAAMAEQDGSSEKLQVLGHRLGHLSKTVQEVQASISKLEKGLDAIQHRGDSAAGRQSQSLCLTDRGMGLKLRMSRGGSSFDPQACVLAVRDLQAIGDVDQETVGSSSAPPVAAAPGRLCGSEA